MVVISQRWDGGKKDTNPAPNKSSWASCALQYYGDGGNAACVKRIRSGEVLKEIFGSHLWRWVEILQEERGEGDWGRGGSTKWANGYKGGCLGRGAVLCLAWSTVPGLRTVGDKVEGHCGSRLEMALYILWCWAWLLEQETDNAVVLDILLLLLQIHPPTAICSWPRGLTCCGPHQQAPLTSGFQEDLASGTQRRNQKEEGWDYLFLWWKS